MTPSKLGAFLECFGRLGPTCLCETANIIFKQLISTSLSETLWMVPAYLY